MRKIDNSINLDIYKKLNEIYDSCKSLEYENETNGLITGKWGRVLFLYQFTKHFKSQSSQDDLENILFSIFENELDFHNTTFAEGLSGIGWTINYLTKENFLSSEDTESLLNNIDEILLNHIDCYDTNKEFDFMYGLLGFGHYFLERKNSSALDIIINKLDNWSVKDENGNKWISINYVNGEPKEVYDLGLAHGISSIIIFLSKCLNLNNEQKTKEMLRKSVDYLVSTTKLSDNNIYPTYIFVANNIPILNNRLGWCYGYLSISLAIWHAGVALNDNLLKETAINNCIQTTYDENLNMTQIMDAGFCHGTSGVAHIYKKMFDYTAKDEFKKAADYWISQTLSFSSHKDGLAGYKAWHYDTGYYNEYGILEGISGIGLVLLNYISDNDNLWDSSMLIS